jgi:hypothetical protein
MNAGYRMVLPLLSCSLEPPIMKLSEAPYRSLHPITVVIGGKQNVRYPISVFVADIMIRGQSMRVLCTRTPSLPRSLAKLW